MGKTDLGDHHFRRSSGRTGTKSLTSKTVMSNSTTKSLWVILRQLCAAVAELSSGARTHAIRACSVRLYCPVGGADRGCWVLALVPVLINESGHP